MNSLLNLLLFLTYVINARVIQFYVEPTQKISSSYISQLVVGNIDKIEQGIKMTASVTLIFDSGYYIIVDSPSATNIKAKEEMLRGIASKNISPGEIQFIVTTHGHPDHFGQGNFFPNARHFFGSYEYNDDNFISTELKENSKMKITRNVELWNTPGHTSQDVSVVVYNTPCCGTVAVVGDLFYNENDALNETEWFADAWNPRIGKINRNKIICAVDYIVPGHGSTFRVTEQMKEVCEKVLPDNLEYSNGENHTKINGESTVASEITSTTVSTTTSSTTSISPKITVDQLKEINFSEPNNLLNHLQEAIGPLGDLSYDQVNKKLQPVIPLSAGGISPIIQSAAAQFAKMFDDSQVTKEKQFSLSRYLQNTFRKFANDAPSLSKRLQFPLLQESLTDHSSTILSDTKRNETNPF